MGRDGKHVCGNGERHDGGGLGMGAWLREGAGPSRGMGRVSGWGLHGGEGICIGRRDLRWAELVDEEVI